MFRTVLFSLVSSTMFLAAASQPAQIRRPLVFEPNRGQAPAPVKWLARGSGSEFFLSDEGLSIMVPERTPDGELRHSMVKMKLDGSRPWNTVTGLAPTGGVSNYIRSIDVKDALTGIPHFGRIRVAGVYDGIDLVFYSHDGELEYDFVVGPGADPEQIHMSFEGQQTMRITDGTGDLMLTTAGGRELRHARPNVYQQTDDKRVPVQGRYQLRSPGHVDVMLAAYDRQLPVVIDPTVTFVQTFGSSVYEGVTASALDFTTTYAAGFTLSTQFPVSNGSSYQAGVCNQSFCSSATNGFVVKINSAGVMLFSTYVGPGPGGAEGIAVDSSGVYVTGSWRIPDSGNVIGYAGGTDLYVLKLSPTGAPIYQRTLGGGQDDSGQSISVDSQHAVWVAGMTRSRELHGGLNGQARALVVKFDATGNRTVLATYGGNGNATAEAVAVDPSDRPWITGQSCGEGFPMTGGVFDANGSCHVFVMQLENNGTGQQRMAMAFGGSDIGDTGMAIAPNGSSTAYVTGVTNGRTFPVTPGAYRTTEPLPGPVAFVTQVDSSSPVGRIVRSTYAGTVGMQTGTAMALHVPEGVYLGANSAANGGSGFVAKLSLDLSHMYYARPVMATVAGLQIIKQSGSTGVPTIAVAGNTTSTASSDGYVMQLVDDLVESRLLWHNTVTGQLSAWTLDAQGTVTAVQTLLAQCSAASGCSSTWKVAGTLDANHDGVGDVLLHNATTGELQVWLLDNTGAVTGTETFSRRCGASDGCSTIWKIVGLGDFNHDGVPDLLWHSDSTGELQAWLRDSGGNVSGTLTLSKRCAAGDGCWTTWKITGIGDFNQDGIDDLFWQNLSTGAIQMSLLNGAGVVTATRALARRCGPTDGCSTTWNSAGLVDVNQDGILDLLWQNMTTGELQGWLLNGTDRIQATQSLSKLCNAASECTPGTIPAGILRATVP